MNRFIVKPNKTVKEIIEGNNEWRASDGYKNMPYADFERIKRELLDEYERNSLKKQQEYIERNA